jgi:hypothetical protein
MGASVYGGDMENDLHLAAFHAEHLLVAVV